MEWKLAWSGGETSTIHQGSWIKCRKLFKYTADLVRTWGHFQFSSVAQFCLTLCDPMNCSTPRPLYPSPTSRVHTNPCPLSQWCHTTISSSVILFSAGSQSFPASGSFQMSHLFASGSQSFRVSASTSALPANIQDWFPLGWIGWISLQSKGLKSLLQHFFKSINSLVLNFLYNPTLISIHDYWKYHSLD